MTGRSRYLTCPSAIFFDNPFRDFRKDVVNGLVGLGDVVGPLRCCVHIQCGQDIVQDQDLSPRVNGPREHHHRLLAPFQHQSLLSNLGPVSRLKQRQILAQSTLVDDLAVPDLVEFGTEQDVIADGLVLGLSYLGRSNHESGRRGSLRATPSKRRSLRSRWTQRSSRSRPV